MTPLYAFSLVPVVSVAMLLFFTLILRQPDQRGLAAYCGAIAFWSLTLLLTFFPAVAHIGLHLAAVGSFIVAGYLHAAYDFTDQKRYGLVWFAYSIALVITLSGAAIPGLLYDPVTLIRGPMFWASMALAMTASLVPMWHLGKAYLSAEGPKRRHIVILLAAGLIGYIGAWSNATMLSHGMPLPYGLFLVLASLLLLATLVQSTRQVADRRLFERSLLYSALTALVSAAFLFGLLIFMSDTAEPLLSEYRLSVLFLLCMAALAIQPIRQHVQEVVGRKVFTGHAHSADLAKALAIQEARAHQAERLAELGTFTSAIAHEVRNPLGVLGAYIALLERQNVDEETLAEMRDQITRASLFIDDLLDYGRPRPLELRMIPVPDTIDLAISSATTALGELAPTDVTWTRDENASALRVEADQAQLLQVLVILFENALLAMRDADHKEIRVHCELTTAQKLIILVEDSGPGIDAAIAPRLFEPFVTSRKRGETRRGTGLGLAIARGIISRHEGTINTTTSTLGGAAFLIELPRHQNVLAAASAADTPDRSHLS